MRIGYARVSTEDQHLHLQLEALQKAECSRIFKEKISGKTRDRLELERMLDQLREGDTVVIWKLDRLARSTRDLLEIVEKIKEAGAGFQSLSEPWADTTSHAGRMILTVFAGIAEFERELIRERTRAGREVAKGRGVRFGRPRKLNEEQKALTGRLLQEGKSVKQVAQTFGVHVSTVYRAETN
ncbi:MAG: recombinase family protein [Deltaproteobacteria bacterium]|nr:recombinase family protein [Deltaproteobacteria bacterium]